MQCRSLRESGSALQALNVVYFMVSVDDASTNREFAISTGADYPILSDPSKATARAYGVLAERGYAARWTYYIDEAGNIAHVDRAVNPATAGQDIVARLRELGVSKKD